MKDQLVSSSAPRPSGPYSPGLILDGGWVFLSGQTAIDPKTGQVAASDIGGQTDQVLDNLEALLKEAGAALDDVIKVSVFLRSMGDFVPMNAVYQRRFRQPYPVRTTVQAGLAEGMLIEVDAIARRDG